LRVPETVKQSEVTNDSDSSGLVTSGQKGVHPRLENTLRRHLESPWLQPFHQPTLVVFSQLVAQGVLKSDWPLILDSGCGTGKSTRQLAGSFPGHIVVGVDQSISRLAKSGVSEALYRHENCILVRGELATFWRLLVDAGFSPERNLLLYPNPWPKTGHLARRWHGHPVFPELLILGGELELRCNWEIYALEFAWAVNFATGANVEVRKIKPKRGISPFEKKYLERGQELFSVTVSEDITRAFRVSQYTNP
jgi:tRNA G46 methylase TrmB